MPARWAKERIKIQKPSITPFTEKNRIVGQFGGRASSRAGLGQARRRSWLAGMLKSSNEPTAEKRGSLAKKTCKSVERKENRKKGSG
jgi:hypothetical protein